MKMVCTGTFYEVKGHRYLIEACRLLMERGVDFEVNLVGVGPMQDDMKLLVEEYGLQERVKFLGRQTREDIARLLHTSDVLVAPSIPTSSGRREGIPVVLMEAMASEVAVIASRISGIPELVDHEINGILVPPADSVAIADAAQKLSARPDFRQRLGQAGREKILSEYDLHKNACQLLNLFTSREKSC